MARVAFRATKAAFERGEEALICGIADDSDTYLMLQRAPEGLPDDGGVYVEHNDQINGAYGCVKRCSLSRTELALDLARQLGNLKGVEGFDVSLEIKDSEYTALRRGLEQIFRDQAGVLTLA